MFDTDRDVAPGWLDLLAMPFWTDHGIALCQKRPFRILLAIPLHGERRGLHLEAALEARSTERGWFPRGMNAGSLRVTYRALIRDLAHQFNFGGEDSDSELPSAIFNRQLNRYRFSFNAIAEAILAESTQSPLPGVSAARTALIVRACGWGQRVPRDARPNQVLIPGPVFWDVDRTPYRELLPLSEFATWPNVEGFFPQRALFRMPEARQLDLDGVDEAVAWLAELTARGHFLAFDARRGGLIRNAALPDGFRLDPKSRSKCVAHLPDWAYRPPKSDPPSNRSDLGHVDSLAMKLAKQKARHRRHKKACNRKFRFESTRIPDT